jgi:TonB-dependent SusC/RagA subfamily outer membrane receptor
MFTGDVSTNNAHNNPLGDINPAYIEDITVLKDAAATAIYGSRAAPGVLVITTKKGKAGSAKVNYDGWFGITKPFKLWDVLNAEQYIAVKNQARANVGLAPAYFMDTINGAPVDTRWYDYIFRTGYAQNHSVNVSGANTSGGRYYMSVGYTRQDGMFINNDFNRIQTRLNVEQKAKTGLGFCRH